jgi:hypothetical protein
MARHEAQREREQDVTGVHEYATKYSQGDVFELPSECYPEGRIL